jgi:hypothetical protein
MRNAKRIAKLAALLLCSVVLWGPVEPLCGADDFYVIGGGSLWKRNGNNIYYTAGNVGIGVESPIYPLTIGGSAAYPVYASSSIAGGTVIQGISTATSGPGWGLYGQTNSSDASAYGVFGAAYGAGAGVKGYTNSSAGAGVYGNNIAGGKAIWGISNGGFGVGVQGESNEGDSGIGVYGIGTLRGVSGIATSPNAAGVFGETDNINSVGISGVNHGNGDAISGFSYGGIGVRGSSTTGYAVYANGRFAATGTKTAIVATSRGSRLLYSQESPEVWFEDFGEGQLVGGLAHIELDPLFLETVTIDDQHPMKVFIQLNDDCNGVYVQRQATGFEVVELRNGTSRAVFTYRVVAKRKGFENARLEPAAANKETANLPVPKQ